MQRRSLTTASSDVDYWKRERQQARQWMVTQTTIFNKPRNVFCPSIKNRSPAITLVNELLGLEVVSQEHHLPSRQCQKAEH